ncbi:diguanylate cyclase (GGDEF) domain-containing protein [Amycolatopsis arida]|uniref:Diguanylate cyclase (GGDEF) domain-containing protein n=1 Tax=Amycolatopsis arida TaxID=587909 RepID=A0A1I5SU24_9PSEU|nr:GGDEF domain-containing protein [Amycolatopsis arida]TDX96350.1 diguanylate cyclase (GGDEF)-like protein [Amycolatopsis arida]SFP74188.1 diguanylate cyclase (GGDEF) domain-containing protein [Amycolatopsis arida]
MSQESLTCAADADPLAVHESAARVFAARGEWRRAYEHLRSALDLDVLTASYNRRYLDRRLAELRDAHPPAVALVDLDLFKSVNDTFGHEVGDQVLREVVRLLRWSLPAGGFCARYGGEEFVLVLPAVGAGAAVALAERARLRVAEHPWERLRPGLAVTVSIGVAHRPTRPRDVSAQLREADDLLYLAKRAGRNRVAYRQYGTVRVVRTVRSAEWVTTRNEGSLTSLERG